MTVITDILPVRAPKVYKSKSDPVVCSNPDLILGLELEIEGCPRDTLWYQTNLEKLWEVKTDGSLRGLNNGNNNVDGNAFEFISKPSQLKILIPELKTFFDTTKFKEENFSDRCSVHVHSNITNLTVHQVGTLFLTYSVVEDVLFKFINYFRVENPRGAYRDTNIYCVPWNQCRLTYDMMNKIFADAEYAFRNWQKYTALNILPSRTLGTVEWRHMHGTADMEKLTRWLNIIGRIFKYAVETPFEDAVETIKRLNDNSAYQQYFTSVFGDYLPYTPEYAKKLESGVVLAKYAMFNLKDYTVKVKEKPATKSLYDYANDVQAMGAIVEDLAGLAPGGFIAGLDRQQMQNAVPQPAPARAEVRIPDRAGVVEPQRIRVAARAGRVAQEQDRRLVRGLVYPLLRGMLSNNILIEPARWGIRDAVGNLRFSDGTRVPPGYVFTQADRAGRYVQGLGANFWNVVGIDWRPGNAPVAAEDEGEF